MHATTLLSTRGVNGVARGRLATALAIAVLGCAPGSADNAPVGSVPGDYIDTEPGLSIHSDRAIIATIRDSGHPRITEAERANRARRIAQSLRQFHDPQSHSDTITVRFLRMARSDLITRRRVTTYSFAVSDIGLPEDSHAKR
jgi:hypothetical protein